MSLPSDSELTEQTYLVERGVRIMALVGSCPKDEVDAARHRLALVAQGRTLAFTVPRGEGYCCGFASHAWAVDLLRWIEDVPARQRDRIIGLLLGYGPDAIRHFDELGTSLGPDEPEEAAAVDKFDPGRSCAKCGGGDATYAYHKKGQREQLPLAGMEGDLLCPTESEHMHRTCQACGYEWAEEPMNAAQ